MMKSRRINTRQSFVDDLRRMISLSTMVCKATQITAWMISRLLNKRRKVMKE